MVKDFSKFASVLLRWIGSVFFISTYVDVKYGLVGGCFYILSALFMLFSYLSRGYYNQPLVIAQQPVVRPVSYVKNVVYWRSDYYI